MEAPRSHQRKSTSKGLATGKSTVVANEICNNESDAKELKRNPEDVEVTFVECIRRKLFAIVLLVAATYGLHECQFTHHLLYSTIANRDYIHAGIFFSSLVMFLSTYLEMYRSLLRGENVHYESAKTTTHGILISIIVAGLCLNIGLWPVWGWLTPFVLFMWSWGFLFQIIVVFPNWVQRFIFAGLYLWFMHVYISPYIM